MKSVWYGAAVAATLAVIGCDNTSNNPSTPPSGTSSTSKTGNNGVMGTNTNPAPANPPATNPANTNPANPPATNPSAPPQPTAWDSAADSARDVLEAAGARIDELAARAQTATGEAKTRIEAAVKDLRGQSTAISARIDELKQNAANKWMDIRDDVTQRLAELNRKIDQAMTPP
jgi:hypothetical protein